ncbi:trypsin-like serine protease [Stigmatella erecta]|uniref:Trypsin n=1 Tax=Stigmatella erecta TaxID=83460 RepID=A0A1I0D0Q0_9BACT|nr:trypsin-like serine protease [Stigmatella erecta]SET25730.1 Trypsin [Stigmatella erecta]
MKRSSLFFLALACLGMACGEVSLPETGLPPDVAQRSDAIINGTYADPNNEPFALLNTHNGGVCTATLHTNYWLLTAKHCLDTYDLTYPHTVQVKMGVQSRRPRKFILHPTEDVAIILLSQPFSIQNDDHSFLWPLYNGPSSALNGQRLLIAGYGGNIPGDNPNTNGAGTLRHSSFDVTVSASAPQFLQVQRTSGRQLAPGDSGGGSFWNEGASTAQCPYGYMPGCIAGISISCDYAPGDPVAVFCTQLAASTFHDWFYANIQPTNAAAFVSQSVPTQVQAGQTFTVSITLRNTGASVWEDYTGYRLGSQAPQDNNIWGAGGRIGLDLYDLVSPGATKTFQFTATAPNLRYTGTRVFQWRMLRENVEWFGDFTPPVSITVHGWDGEEPEDPCEARPWLCEEPDICDTQPWKCPLEEP